MAELKCLFMSKNVLHGLEGIHQLAALATLDVSHNDLYSLAPVSALASLQSLNAGYNKVSSAEDLAPLQHCMQLKTLDLEKNRIACPEALNTIMTLPLALLRLVGNPVVSSTKCDAPGTLRCPTQQEHALAYSCLCWNLCSQQEVGRPLQHLLSNCSLSQSLGCEDVCMARMSILPPGVHLALAHLELSTSLEHKSPHESATYE